MSRAGACDFRRRRAPGLTRRDDVRALELQLLRGLRVAEGAHPAGAGAGRTKVQAKSPLTRTSLARQRQDQALANRYGPVKCLENLGGE